jgi:hypothetical protein
MASKEHVILTPKEVSSGPKFILLGVTTNRAFEIVQIFGLRLEVIKAT